jgi:predicted RND superfamily exporter protein
MAIVVIGGLVTSTFLSLLVIPVIFTYVDDFGRLVTGWFRSEAAKTAARLTPEMPVAGHRSA